MKRIFSILLVLMMVLSLAACGGAANPSSDTNVSTDGNTAKVFILGLDDSFPPMGYRDESNNIVGFDIDLAKEVCNRIGAELKLQPISWDAKEMELNNKNIDCIWNGMTVTPERAAAMTLSESYLKNRQVLVVKADASYTDLASLKGKKLSLQKGSSAATALDASTGFKASLGAVNELPDNMKALVELDTGLADAVLMDEIVANYYITNKQAKYKVLNEALAEEEYAIGFRKDDPLAAEVGAALTAMKADGTLAKISTDWFGKDITIIK